MGLKNLIALLLGVLMTILGCLSVDAVVYDAPNLLHYANGEGKGRVMVVGKTFALQDYAIALPRAASGVKKLIEQS